MAGVNSLAGLSPALHNPEASLLPDLADVRAVSVDVTAGVVRQAVREGNATDEMTIKVAKGEADVTLEEFIKVSRSLNGPTCRADPPVSYVGCGLQAARAGRLGGQSGKADRMSQLYHTTITHHRPNVL
jgi:hypothetical protein